MATKTKFRKFTDDEKQAWKEEKQAEQKRLLEDAVREFTSREAWEAWIRSGRSNLSKYSFTNALLIWHQKKDATLVHGKKQWEKERVTVNEDARRIAIFAPMIVAVKGDDGKPVVDDDGKPVKRVAFFKTVYVYDVSETDRAEVKEPKLVPLQGDDLADYIAPLEDFARSMGYLVRYREGATGWSREDMEIAVDPHLSGNELVHTLVRATAQAYGDVTYEDYGKAEAEVIVESAAVMALGMLGFDVREAEVPYIAQWSEGSVEALKKYANTVDDLVKTITEKMGL